MPRRRINRLSKKATIYIFISFRFRCTSIRAKLTSMPDALSKQQPIRRFAYRILPLRIYGHPTLATRAGAILQKAIMPFGVDGGTKSKAADSMITYSTKSFQLVFLAKVPKTYHYL